MLYGWKENPMLTNCLAACAHLTITVSEIERDIGRKSSFFHTPLHSTSRLISATPLGTEKLELLGYPMVKKISKTSLFVLAQLTNVTDRRTDRHRMPAIAALMHSIARRQCQESVTSINETVIDCLQSSDTKTRCDEKMTSFPKSCISFSG